MARFFFKLCIPGSVAHQELVRELPDLNAALIEAQRSVSAVVRKHRLRSQASLRGSFDIEDAYHNPVARIMLADVARQIG